MALDEHRDLAVRRPIPEDVAVLPAAAIFGGNASGKSNLLQAVRFMAAAVANSHQRWRPGAPIARNAFRFDQGGGDRPSEFCVDVALDGVHYEYGFSVDDQVVRGEWLYSFTRRQRRVRRLLFERSGPGGDSIRFGEHTTDQACALLEAHGRCSYTRGGKSFRPEVLMGNYEVARKRAQALAELHGKTVRPADCNPFTSVWELVDAMRDTVIDRR